MTPLCIVVFQDIVDTVELRFLKTVIAIFRHPLCFKASKKSLYHRVIPAIPSSAHTLSDLICSDVMDASAPKLAVLCQA